jgi:hypothetical protein
MSMTLISTVTVGSGGTSSIDFTSIPSNFTDLIILHSSRITQNSPATFTYLKFNNNTSGYADRVLYGTGVGAASLSSSSATELRLSYTNDASMTANTFASQQIYIPNYAGSTNKSVSIDGVLENNASQGGLSINAGLWANTAAITSISIFYGSLTYAQNTTASLYGITKGSGGATVS